MMMNVFNKRRTVATALAAVFGLSGCHNFGPVVRDPIAESARTVSTIRAQDVSRSTVEESDRPFVRAESVDYEPSRRGGVTMRIANAPVYFVVKSIADTAGFSVSLADRVDGGRRISLDVRKLTPEDAVKQAAFAAGYIAVVDRERRSVVLTEHATYTYNVGAHVLQQMTTTFSITSNPSMSGGAGGGAGGAGGAGGMGATGAPGGGAPGGGATGGTQQTTGAGGGAASSANTVIAASARNDAAAVARFLTDMAGRGASVQVMNDSGLISVRGNSQQLKRISDFLEGFVAQAMSQVELKVHIVEVALQGEFQSGIDWTKIWRDTTLGSITLGLANGAVVANPALSVGITSASSDAIIKALETRTSTRVVSQPSGIALNHQAATIFDGTQVPYLGSVTTTVAGTSGTLSNSGSLSYAMDGVSLSFRPNIIDKTRVQITVMPVVSTVAGFRRFNLGGGGLLGGGTVLEAPNQPTNQSFFQLLAESGKTIVIGGQRVGNAQRLESGIPGLKDVPLLNALTQGYNNRERNRELVIMISTHIIPAPRMNTLLSETL